jgi:endonuclease G, mitochondrial
VASGYDPDFLPGQSVPPPAPATKDVEKDLAPTKQNEPVRHYTHFSLAMSASRRFCRWVAWNIDGNGLQQLSRTGIDFVIDDEYEPKFQVDDDLYSSNRLDRGHIARRGDLLWGTREEAEQANRDSFFFTNITPQLDDFNQSGQHGLWGEVENAIFDDVEVEALRVSLFGGPIFKDTDFPYRDTFVPRSFWKVVAYVEQGTLKAQAFVLTQDDLESKLPSFGLEQFKLFQVSLGDLSGMTGLDFGDLTKADTLAAHPGAVANGVRRIEARSQIAAG